MRHLCQSMPVLFVVLATALAITGGRAAGPVDPNLQPFPDASGFVRTFSARGFIDTTNPFFQSLCSNGRACVTCHQPGDAWSVTPAHLRARFESSGGLDPIFRTNDGSISPVADVSTVAARRSAYSMLLGKGLIRVGLGIPAHAEFSLVGVEDPYGYASAKELSLFRRILPSTNLGFLSGVMWDGRQTHSGLSMGGNLMAQAQDATRGHAQASSPPTIQQLQQIVSFELGLCTAQSVDHAAGPLDIAGGMGGPRALMDQRFFIGINDPLGFNPMGAPFDANAFTIYDGWANAAGRRPNLYTAGRQAVARGQRIFNTRKFTVTGVGGLNDALGAPSLEVGCTTCHDSPNAGNHSVSMPLNIGISDASRRTPDLPLYTLRNNTTGEIVETTDPGRALISGRWGDIGKFKGPILRGLAARAPYFHNGSAATLDDAVNFYDDRFQIGLTRQEKADLVAFLRSL